MSKWIAMYSHTGKELQQICKKLKRVPDLVVYCPECPPAYSGKNVYNMTPVFQDDPLNVNRMLDIDLAAGDLVTLHGYMYILPDYVLEKPGVRFVNGHPGLITEYPELKGKDPQVKVLLDWDKYDLIGCVLHEVTPQVDGGSILGSMCTLRPKRRRQLYSELRKMSLKLWIEYLEVVLIC